MTVWLRSWQIETAVVDLDAADEMEAVSDLNSAVGRSAEVFDYFLGCYLADNDK